MDDIDKLYERIEDTEKDNSNIGCLGCLFNLIKRNKINIFGKKKNNLLNYF
tara:strand:- start:1614 stop:1766 length:153 start_codon:yes stop_codon:yes gene_type:complete